MSFDEYLNYTQNEGEFDSIVSVIVLLAFLGIAVY
jgi:hypothetical protein